jgi:hypothetical protein
MKKIKIPPFFISMETAAKFVLPIPIFFAYFIPLDLDVGSFWHVDKIQNGIIME